MGDSSPWILCVSAVGSEAQQPFRSSQHGIVLISRAALRGRERSVASKDTLTVCAISLVWKKKTQQTVKALEPDMVVHTVTRKWDQEG